MEIYEYIGGRLRSLREQRQLSQDTLGKALRVSTNTISRWETATYKPSIGELQKIASFFQVRLSALLPPEDEGEARQKALLSATGDLTDDDIQELIEYAAFRRMRALDRQQKQRR